MLARVAAFYGQGFWAVADAPYHETLHAYAALLECERVAAADASMGRLDQASLVAVAMHEGRRLEGIRHQRLQGYRLPPTGADAAKERERVTTDLARIARMHRAIRRRRRN